MTSTVTPASAAARSASPLGEMTLGGASTSSRAALVQRATSAARSATGASCVAGAADHEALDAARALTAAPAARVVAADDRAFGQRTHLFLDGEGSAASSAHATVPPPRHARTARAAAVRSPSMPGSSATTASGASAVNTIATGSASATARSGAPSSRRPRARRGGDQFGPDGGRLAGAQLDMHRVTTTIRLSESFARISSTGL